MNNDYGAEITEYLKTHGNICDGFMGIRVSSNKISIPVKDKDGNILFHKHRVFGQNMKYLYDKGSKVSLFGVDNIDYLKEMIYITEGEFDAMALYKIGRNAVSSTGGALSWQDSFNEQIKMFYETSKLSAIAIVYDNDKAGAMGAYKTWSSLAESNMVSFMVIIPKSHGKDVCDHINNSLHAEIMCIPRFFLPFKKTRKAGYSKAEVQKSLKEIFEALQKMKWDSDYNDKVVYIDVFKSNIAEELKFLKRTTSKKHYTETIDVKQIPISDFVQFDNRGFAQCLFHADKSPSMIYNGFNSNFPNTVKCFACGKFGSVVDVIMAQKSCEFKEAVNFLKSKII